ncbi:surfactin synthase thioesterase subunit [Mumia flava]|uniref:Surfactin synthase thioesterase subunit n=1 Tax=Mumia flava TaxID=1348852 RepID=A0A0B2AYC1_9ACTN|nr:thioesterase domain-containing protein [Mumia flava]PJJ54098.1 surfactin synthase thioesterase subunit [Mumia flava]
MSPVDRLFPYRKATDGFELFAFPHVGAGPTLFHALRAAAAQEGVAVSGALLPGRGRRVREAPHRTVDALLAEIEEVARDDGSAAFSGDYGLLGHCSGSLIAFEVARLLVRLPCANPRLLVICSCRPPEVIPDTGTSRLPRADMLERTAALGGMPDALFADQDLLDLLEQPLRADWEIFDRYVYEPGPALPFPILAARGAHDLTVPPEEQPRWQAHTHRPLQTVELPTDHWMLSDEGSRRLAREIATAVSAIRA